MYVWRYSYYSLYINITIKKGRNTMFKTLKKAMVLVLACALVITGSFFTEPVSAAGGPTDTQKTQAQKLTIGETVKGKLLGSSSEESTSELRIFSAPHSRLRYLFGIQRVFLSETEILPRLTGYMTKIKTYPRMNLL